MSLADDLRSAAADHAAAAISQALASGADPYRLAHVAVQAAAPLLLDAHLVDEVLRARRPPEQAAPTLLRPRPRPRRWCTAGLVVGVS
ncbi:hypothetical protein [Phytohabitans houttuyneae]|nr:hypothetical protein [Phytohabitans houttuyneae]